MNLTRLILKGLDAALDDKGQCRGNLDLVGPIYHNVKNAVKVVQAVTATPNYTIVPAEFDDDGHYLTQTVTRKLSEPEITWLQNNVPDIKIEQRDKASVISVNGYTKSGLHKLLNVKGIRVYG